MKNFKLRCQLIVGLFILILFWVVLFPFLFFLALVLPQTLRKSIFKLVNTFNLISWLNDIADLNDFENEI